MAYKVIILYQLYMPSYFLGTFTEYPDISLCLYDISAQFENGTYFILLYPYTALLPISSSMRNN